MKKLFTTLAVVLVALFATSSASAFKLSLESYGDPLNGTTVTPEQIYGLGWGLVGGEGTVSLTNPDENTVTIFEPNMAGTFTVNVLVSDWGVNLAMGKIEWENKAAGEYTIVVPEGLLTADNGTNETAQFTFTLDNGAGGGDAGELKVNPESGSVVESLSTIAITLPFEAGYIIKPTVVTVTKDGQLFCGATGTPDEVDYYVLNLKLETTATEPGEYTVYIPANTIPSYDGSETYGEEIELTYIIEGTGGNDFEFTVDPASGSTVESLTTIAIGLPHMPDLNHNANQIQVMKGGEIFCGATVSIEEYDESKINYVYVNLATPATEAGEYMVYIPANTFKYYESPDFYDMDILLNYTVTGAGTGGDTPATSLVPNYLYPASGEQLSLWQNAISSNITIAFPENVTMKAGATATFAAVGQDYSKVLEIQASTLAAGTFFVPLEGIDDIPGDGQYTVTIPAGAFTDGTLESGVIEGNYTIAGFQTGGDEPEADLEVTSLVFNMPDGQAVNMLGSDVKLNEFTQGMTFSWACGVAGPTDIMSVQVEIYNGEDYIGGWRSETKNAEGQYTYNPWTFPTKFYDNATYRVIVTAYNGTNGGNTTKTYGPVEFTFTGTNKGYEYSDVTMEDIQPAPGAEITNAKEKFVLTFSGPVEKVEFDLNEGGQGGETVTLTGTPNASKTIWTFDASSVWARSDHAWYTDIQAFDDAGRVVKGNKLENEASFFEFEYTCFLAGPGAALTPAAGPVLDKLYAFTAVQGQDAKDDATIDKGISPAWTGFPYLVDQDGNTVANADGNSFENVYYDAAGNEVEGGFDQEPDAVRFNLNKEITTPGNYTLIVPHATFNFGSESASAFNRYQEFAYSLVSSSEVIEGLETVKVAITNADCATASFEAIKGKAVTANFTPTEGWAFASLTLDGADVTADVADNAYTFTPAADAALVATYEFATEIEIIESNGTLDLTDRQLTIENVDAGIRISGLAQGDIVKVYSVNGMLLASLEATLDQATISVPAGVYVVMVNDKAVKVKH